VNKDVYIYISISHEPLQIAS